MRLFKRIHSGFAADILSLTFVIISALSSVMFIFRALGFAEYIFTSSDGPAVLIMFIVFLIPDILKITVPVALLLATTISTVRMSHDRELEAWQASGVGTLRLAFMPLLLGFAFAVLAAYSSLYLQPHARREWLKFRYMHAQRSVETLIENKLQPKTFISDLFSADGTNISLFFESMSENKREMNGIFISFQNKDNQQNTVLSGTTGTLQKVVKDGLSDYIFTVNQGHYYTSEPQQDTVYSALLKTHPDRFDVSHLSQDSLQQLDGENPFPQPANWTVVAFDTLEVSLLNMFQRSYAGGEVDETDMRSQGPVEYYRALKKIRAEEKDWQSNPRFIRDHTYFYELIVVAASCLFLPVLGMCLGMLDPRRRGGVAYLGMSIIVFFFYASVMFSQKIPRQGVPPEIMLVLPTSILLFFTLVCLRWRTAYPPSVGFLEALKLDFRRLAKFLRGQTKGNA